MIKSIVFVLSLSMLATAQRSARNLALLETGREASVTDTGVLSCVLDPSAGVQTGVVVPGALQALAGDHFLVAGRDDIGNGLVEHWKFVAGVFQKQSSLALPGMDFSGVAYDAAGGALYLMDCAAKLINRADWDVALQLPTAWTTWATVMDVPELQEAGERYLAVSPAANGSAAELYLGPHPELYAFEATLMSGEPGSIVTTSWNWSDFSTIASELADQRTASEAGANVTVWAAAGTQVEVVHVATGVVLGTGTVPPGQSSVVVGVSPTFALGEAYVARALGDPLHAHRSFHCMRRYGAPEQYSDGTRLSRLYNPENLRVGNADFILVGGASREPAPSSELPLSGYLAIGFRDSSGVDPIVPHGGNSLLVTDVCIPAAGVLSVTGQGLFHGMVPVPADPNLEGGVVLFQFWMNDGGVIRLSEVVGIEVGPARSAFRSAVGSASRSTAEQQWVRELVRSGKATRSSMPLEQILRQAGS